MHKIYSRPRIRIPKIILQTGMKNYTKNKKIEKVSTVTIILIIAFTTVKIIIDAVFPIFDTLCENKACSIATIVSNEQATNVMKEHTYDEIFTIEKDEKRKYTNDKIKYNCNKCNNFRRCK